MKKTMKKTLNLLLLFLFVLSLCQPIVFAQNSVNIRVDGETRSCAVEPFIQNGRTLVSLKDISALLDIEFQHDAETNLITAATEDYSVELTVGAEKAKGTRVSYTLDVPAQSIDDKIVVPIRFIAEQLGYKVAWEQDTGTVVLEELKLIRDEPTEAQKWAIARARQLTEFKFTPIKDIPINLSSSTWGFFEAGKEYKGFPYGGGLEANDKFVGENVSFETFLSALANPDSVLYTRDLYKELGSVFYGIVCNGLVRYSLGIDQRYSTEKFLDIPGMNQVCTEGQYTVNDLELADVLHAHGNGTNHVILVTGILRDETGEIVKVELSEAVRTTCRRRLFSVEDFHNKYMTKYKVCRYEYLDEIPPFDEEQDKILFESGIDKKAPMIAVDYGDKSNYAPSLHEGDKTIISVFAEGENTVQILRDGALVEEIKVNGYQKIERKFEPGYYVAKLANTEHSTEFCVCKPEITHTVKDGVITINVSSGDPESEISHMDFRVPGERYRPLHSIVELTEEEKKTGVIVREIPEGAGNYKISFKNKYGIWTVTMITI